MEEFIQGSSSAILIAGNPCKRAPKNRKEAALLLYPPSFSQRWAPKTALRKARALQPSQNECNTFPLKKLFLFPRKIRFFFKET